jgi:hypothetical protein
LVECDADVEFECGVRSGPFAAGDSRHQLITGVQHSLAWTKIEVDCSGEVSMGRDW